MSKTARKAILHLGLFVVTFATTTIAGSAWSYNKFIIDEGYGWNEDFTLDDFLLGVPYSVVFLSILTVHEFGHYFVAMYHRVRATLPYYLPLPPPFLIGSLGAVIRLLSRVPSREKNFDIGIAGPLAGFALALGFLIYGFATLPGLDFLFAIHPEYAEYGADYAQHVYTPEKMAALGGDMVMGKNLLFIIFEWLAPDPSLVPNGRELMHYPLLYATYWGLVFTAINLLPIGQLDGGHVVYGLFGRRVHRIIGSVFLWILILYAGLGVLPPGAELPILGLFNVPHVVGVPVMIGFYYFCLRGLKLSQRDTVMHAILIFVIQYVLAFLLPAMKGYSSWFVFALIVSRFVTVLHPGAEVEAPISKSRKVLGWIALIVFVLCFTPNPIEINVPQQ